MPPFDPEVQSTAVCALVSKHHEAGRQTIEHIYGLAVFHEERRSLRICEYTEDSYLSRTEALLLQIQPRTCCVLLSDDQDSKKLSRVAESCGVELTPVKKDEMKQVELEQDLLRLLVDAQNSGLGRHLEEQRRKQGMRALQAVIGQYGLLSEPANFGACTLGLYPLSSFMYLDKAAFSALNVLPRPEESLRSSSSLLGFLNRCRSPMGMRRLRQWLTQPLTSAEDIRSRHDVVEAFVSAESLLRQVEGHLRHVPDLERMAARFHCTRKTASKASKASLEDLVTLYQCVLSSESMVKALQTYDGVHREVVTKEVCNKLQACVADFRNLRSLVMQTIDLKQAEMRNYCINTAFDVSLQRLAAQRDQVRDQMEIVKDKVADALKIQGRGNEKPVALLDSGEGKGQALRVTKKHQSVVQNYKGPLNLKVLAFKKLETVFTTPELEKLNQQFEQATRDYDKQSEQLVIKALGVAATYSSVVERLGELLGSLDVLVAFARVVLTAPCTFCRPTIDESCQTFKIEAASHVLVVANSDKSFVANGLDMNKESSRLHLITGPNMGGKSTYIRSVSLIALLNQVGCFVPCRTAVLPIFDAIYCRVGASDMQLRGISTFMAEMLEASCILNTATDRSLVIVDELGRGTSTSDGFGIAWAIARHLTEVTRCFSLFATHFHELAELEDAAVGVRNKHATAAVDAASGQLTFLYALKDGAADQSYGAHVAELAGFPDRVVAAARKRAEEFEASGAFGKGASKRARTDNAQSDKMTYVMASNDEDEFVRRCMEQAAQLRRLGA